MEAKAWQAFYATLLLERSKFGLNELLDARLQSTRIPTAFGEHALVRPVVASRGRLGEASASGRAAKAPSATLDNEIISARGASLDFERPTWNYVRA